MNARLTAAVVSAAPPLAVGECAVVAQAPVGSLWNTGRTYGTRHAAHARQAREMNRSDCNAYVVRRHTAGMTVYLSVDTILGTVTQ